MATDETLRDLTLMLAYLTAWKESPDSLLRCWKGYDWDALDRLEQDGMIEHKRGNKSMYLTPEGGDLARQLLARYGIAVDAGGDGK